MSNSDRPERDEAPGDHATRIVDALLNDSYNEKMRNSIAVLIGKNSPDVAADMITRLFHLTCVEEANKLNMQALQNIRTSVAAILQMHRDMAVTISPTQRFKALIRCEGIEDVLKALDASIDTQKKRI